MKRKPIRRQSQSLHKPINISIQQQEIVSAAVQGPVGSWIGSDRFKELKDLYGVQNYMSRCK